jgi:hypothetical protein
LPHLVSGLNLISSRACISSSSRMPVTKSISCSETNLVFLKYFQRP